MYRVSAVSYNVAHVKNTAMTGGMLDIRGATTGFHIKRKIKELSALHRQRQNEIILESIATPQEPDAERRKRGRLKMYAERACEVHSGEPRLPLISADAPPLSHTHTHLTVCATRVR